MSINEDHPTLIDSLDRIPLVTKLARAVLNCTPPRVFGVHGDWGAGKTSFLHQLHRTELFRAGTDLFRARPDKSWSLTDCLSFVVMEREGLTEALTADHHFTQAGFHAVLREALPK